MAIEREASTAVCSWYLTTQECAMNAFVEHHNNSIQFGYRCFDRLLLNGLIQPFQQPERVLGFFNTYREGKRVTRKTLTDIADQFQYWLKNRSEKWGAPILEPPDGDGDERRRNKFVELGPDVRAHVSLFPIFGTGVPEPAPLAGDSDEGRGHRLSAMHQRILEVRQSGAPARTGRLAHYSGPVEVRPEVARRVHPVPHGQGAQARWVSTSAVLLAGGVLRQPHLPSPRRGGPTH